MKLIKYSNRKLYVKGASGYMNASDIVDYIANGGEIQVTCHKTKTDITLEVLKSLVSKKKNLDTSLVYDLLRK